MVLEKEVVNDLTDAAAVFVRIWNEKHEPVKVEVQLAFKLYDPGANLSTKQSS